MITTVAGPQYSKKPYPKLMECSTGGDKGMIVLMSKAEKGVVLFSPCTSSKAQGYYSDGWMMDKFVDYAGSITLEN